MNKPRLSLAAASLLAACSAASAQSSVTIYGIADMLVEHRNHMSASQGKRISLSSGGMNSSRWGLRGSEDLGGGLKAIFNLESEIFMDTGGADTAYWGRQATVGLQGDFGRVVAGRTYTTSYDFVLPFDPMGYAQFYSWATSGGNANVTGGVLRKDGLVSRVDNIVKYEGKLGPVKLGASLAAGEGTAGGRYAALGAAYEADGLAAVLVMEQRSKQTGGPDKDQISHWGLSYEMKPVKAFLAQRQYKRTFTTATTERKSSMTWVGATWSASPQLDLTAAYYFQDIKSGPAVAQDPHMLALRAKYALSKRTWLYAVASNAKTKSGVVSVSRDDNAFADTQSSFGLGIQHRF